MALQTPTAETDHTCQREGPAIHLAGLSLRYGQHLALDSISLEVAGGERVAVVGPNGAGKSSLFYIISGVLQPSAGRASVHGHSPAQYLCTAYLPQSGQIDWNFPLTVSDVVMMGRTALLGLFRRPRAEDWAAVEQALERLKIADLAQRQISQLSGGQRQRMFIARSLAQQPALLLLDEPLSGLDLRSQDLIFDVLEDLKAEEVTVLFATHDLNLAGERFDRVMLLNQQLVGFGAAEQVFTQDNLQQAYEGHVHLVETPEGPRILGDMGGHHHDHSEEIPQNV